MASPPRPKSAEERILERIERRRTAPQLPDVLSDTPERVRLALALLPSSTREILASLASGPPIDAALEALTAEGLVDADPGALASTSWALRNAAASLAPGLRPSFALRQRIIDAFLRSYGDLARGAHALMDECREIGQALEPGAEALPETTRRWVRLAADPAGAAAHLDAAVSDAADRADSADVSRWIDAAVPLAALLERDKDMSLTLAVERSGRRLELLHREQADRRHLETFFERSDQIAALGAFLDGRGGDDRWMLHLLGSGGVGKTMLIRHLLLQMARARGFVSARVDFDFLSPDYPRLDPGLLLWSLGRELQLRTTNDEAVRAFKDAEAKFRHLSDVLRGQRAPVAEGGERATRHPLFVEATFQFVSALKLTAAPIVLVLDTCEELVKGRSRGGPADAVVETFRILHALRHGARSLVADALAPGDAPTNLRVVFAGRRPLACAGDGWTADSDLPARPDLSVFELRGFSTSEAESWLARTLHTPIDLVPAVIAATPDMDPGARVSWADGRATPEVGKNPYDLKHFAEWAKETPPPSREVLASGSTRQYVEQRILSKLEHPDLAQFLAALSVVKHADRALLAASIDVERFDERLDLLTGHEWIARRVVSEPDGRARVIYQLEERLRRRLRRYFGETGVDLAAIAARAAPWLHALTIERDLAHVDVADVDAALRAFELEPDAGRAWWLAFVRRVIVQRDFNALLRFTDFLLGDEQAAGRRASPQAPPEHPLRAQVLGDQAAALARTGAFADSGRDWLAVAEMLTGRAAGGGDRILDPTPAAPVRDELLAIRSLSGQIAASAARFDAAELSQAVTLLRPVLDRVMGDVADRRVGSDAPALFSTLTALEALVERAELLIAADGNALREIGAVRDWPITHVAALATSEGSSATVTLGAAMWCLALGRALTYFREETAAATCFAAARSGVRRVTAAGGAVPPLLDWTPPANAAARVLAEAIRHGAPIDMDAVRLEQIDRSIELALYVSPDFDADRDRLWSVLLLDRARRALSDVEAGTPRGDDGLANQIAAALQAPLPGPPSPARACGNVHRAIPPLAIVGAQLTAERGELSKGLALLMAAAGNQALERHVREHAARALTELAALLRRPILDRGLLEESTAARDVWTVARARFVCDRFGIRECAATLRELVEREDLLLGFVRPASEGPAGSLLQPRDTWRLTPGRITAVHGPLQDGRRAARIDAVAAELLARREEARSLFDAGDLLGFVDPLRARPLLQRADVLYEEAGDPLGRVAALTRLAVLLASEVAADTAAIQATLDDCRRAYEQLIAAAPDERWTPWSAIVEGEPLVSHSGNATDWPFRLALCHVRLRELRIETPGRESAFAQREQVFLLHGPLADALQLLGRDPWSGDTGDEEARPAWLDSALWRLVKNLPTVRRLIAALIRVCASVLEGWIRIVARVNPRTTDAASPTELLRRRLETTAACIDPPDARAAETIADEDEADATAEPMAAPAPGPSSAPRPSAPVALPAEAPAASSARSSPSISLWFVAFGIAIWGALGVLGFSQSRPLLGALTGRGWSPPDSSASGWQIGAEIGVFVVLVLLAFAALGGLVAWVERARARRSRILLQAESTDTSVLNGRLSITVSTVRSRFPRRGHLAPEPLGSTEGLVDLLQPDVLDLYLASFGATLGAAPRIDVRAEGTLARRTPWELLLAGALQTAPDRLRLVHRGGAAQAAAFTGFAPTVSAPAVSPAHVFVLTGHESSARFAEDAWRTAGARVEVTRPGWPMGIMLRNRALYRLVHVIGDIESRGADLRVRPAAEGASVGVDEIAEMFGRPALLILQGPLRPEQTPREDSDRLEAAARRELAYRLHDTGIPLVLVLPRLDPSTCPEALARLVGAATRGRRVEDWLDAVAAIRAAIGTHAAAIDDGRELAGDVSLFAGEWNERVVP